MLFALCDVLRVFKLSMQQQRPSILWEMYTALLKNSPRHQWSWLSDVICILFLLLYKKLAPAWQLKSSHISYPVISVRPVGWVLCLRSHCAGITGRPWELRKSPGSSSKPTCLLAEPSTRPIFIGHQLLQPPPGPWSVVPLTIISFFQQAWSLKRGSLGHLVTYRHQASPLSPTLTWSLAGGIKETEGCLQYQ